MARPSRPRAASPPLARPRSPRPAARSRRTGCSARSWVFPARLGAYDLSPESLERGRALFAGGTGGQQELQQDACLRRVEEAGVDQSALEQVAFRARVAVGR